MRTTIAALLLLAASATAAEQWRIQYFHDAEDGSEFVITGLAFPTAERGIAAGRMETSGKAKPYAVATTDGGRTWQPLRIPESALSVFFVSAQTGWIVGPDHIWRTGDFGQTWKRTGKAEGALRVWFRDEQHGWAAGEKKAVYETSDGGATWTNLAAAAEPKTTPDYTVYDAISFANADAGMIAGWSKPPRRGESDRQPEWLDPEKSGRREWPGVSIILETHDGGAHWKPTEASMFGSITQLRLAPDGRGLGLIEFFDRFDYPSEVYQLDWRSGKSGRSFRRKDRAVTDVWIGADGPAYLAAVEPTGTLYRSPVPGKLKLLKSNDLAEWTEMDVDYRAVARRAVLASSAPGQIWAGTDTGMILRLTAE